jgi:hypothetical protein
MARLALTLGAALALTLAATLGWNGSKAQAKGCPAWGPNEAAEAQFIGSIPGLGSFARELAPIASAELAAQASLCGG